MAAGTSVLERAQSYLERHHFTPFAHEPPPDTPEERRRWRALMLAGWLTMGGALLASTALIDSGLLLIVLTVTMLVAFPVVKRLHFSEWPRFWINWLTLIVAIGLGIMYWRLGLFTGGETASRMVLSYRTLVGLFYWVMVFRAFTIREASDLTQTALPAASGLLLILVAAPTPVAYLGTALVITGTIALLAGEHATDRESSFHAVVGGDRIRGGRWRPKANSWVSLLAGAAIAAVILAAVAARVEPSNAVGRWVRAQLSDRLARMMIRERPSPHVSSDSMALGGPAPTPQDRLMLTVRSEYPTPMRILTYELYTGESWKLAEREWDRATRSVDGWHMPPPEDFGLASEVTDDWKIQVRAGWAFRGALPVPWCAQSVRLDAPSVRVNSAGIVGFSGHVEAGDSYAVTSAVPTAISAPAGTPPPPRVGLENALQLPEDLPQRVRDLAREVSEQTSERPAEVVMAVDAHLKINYDYDDDAAELPEGEDFVDHFLFEEQRGYCQHFATAMVVMLRTLDIPARLVTGFTAGEYIESHDVYEIRDQDAHAWVEVYFEDSGWIDFDPTPDAEETEQTLAGGISESFGQLGAMLSSAANWARQNAIRLSAIIFSTVGLLAAMVLGGRWYHRRLTPLRRNATASERIVHAYNQALRWLEREGIERPPSLAPWEYQEMTAGNRPQIADDMHELTGQYIRARYGCRSPEPGAADAAENALKRMREIIFSPNGTKEPDGVEA